MMNKRLTIVLKINYPTPQGRVAVTLGLALHPLLPLSRIPAIAGTEPAEALTPGWLSANVNSALLFFKKYHDKLTF